MRVLLTARPTLTPPSRWVYMGDTPCDNAALHRMASSLTSDRLLHIFNTYRIAEVLRSNRAAALSTLGLALAVPFAIRDYHVYLSYGPGGLPYNVGGWIVTNILRLFAREQLSTAPYEDQKLRFSKEPGYLPADFPPKRRSSRPKLGPHPIPQRQLDQLPGEEIRQELIDRFAQVGSAASQKGLVEIKQSLYERRHSALFVSLTRPWHALAQQTRGEISHVHAGLDGSVHVVLHPSDCWKVIESGWGQRHGFAGVEMIKSIAGASLPVNYVLVYAPRDPAEVDIVMTIVKASIQFMAGTREAVE